jgi:hypothetical protein
MEVRVVAVLKRDTAKNHFFHYQSSSTSTPVDDGLSLPISHSQASFKGFTGNNSQFGEEI